MIAFAGGLRLLDGPVTAALSSAALVVGAAALWWAWGRWVRPRAGRTSGPTQGGWGDIGIVPLATGLMGWCPLYTVLGINTCPVNKG